MVANRWGTLQNSVLTWRQHESVCLGTWSCLQNECNVSEWAGETGRICEKHNKWPQTANNKKSRGTGKKVIHLTLFLQPDSSRSDWMGSDSPEPSRSSSRRRIGHSLWLLSGLDSRLSPCTSLIDVLVSHSLSPSLNSHSLLHLDFLSPKRLHTLCLIRRILHACGGSAGSFPNVGEGSTKVTGELLQPVTTPHCSLSRWQKSI